MRSFAYPYFSQSVAEFWRRWNISVSSWFRDYVYIPLGGSRVSLARLGLNIVITFLLSGLWHGANVTFVVWGLILGVGVAFTALRRAPVLRAEDTPGGERLTWGSAARMLITFAFITMSWVFFRSASIAEAFGVLARMAHLPALGTAWLEPLALFPGTRKVLIATLVAFVAIEWVQRRRECPLEIPIRSRAVRWIAYTGVLWLTALLAQPMASGRFIYFNF
jgi:D-alanyl-lipoteichoic acid acyltransferase DltB (MBOAT superfamily)